jgi:FxLD family lantipeptide
MRRHAAPLGWKGVNVSASITPKIEGLFDLDIRIVEAGPAAAVLFEDTDDGCNTVKGSDC